MPLHKKITAIVVFALCGFLGGFVSNAFAANFPIVSLTSGGLITFGASSFYAQNITYSGVTHAASCSSVNSTGAATDLPHAISVRLAGHSPSEEPATANLETEVVGAVDGTWSIGAGVGNVTDFCDTFYRSSGVWSTDPPNIGLPSTATAITSVTPSGTISSSSPLTIVIEASIKSEDLASSTANGGTLRIFSWVGGVDTAFVSPSHAFNVTASGATTTSYTVTTDLPAGNFKIYASVYELDSYGAFGPTYAATTTYFTLNTSYFEHLTGTSTPYQLGYKNAPCGITDVSGCFQNAIAFLFYPSVSPGQAFTTISDSAQGKFPFVYAYQLGAIRTSLLTASSTAPTGLTVNLWKLPNTATSTIELISETKVAAVPFSGTIYTVLTWLIWLGMAEYIYYRVIRMHDVNTPPT